MNLDDSRQVIWHFGQSDLDGRFQLILVESKHYIASTDRNIASTDRGFGSLILIIKGHLGTPLFCLLFTISNY